MEKNIKDYLYLYLGSKIKCQRMGETGESVEMTGISWDGTQNITWVYFEDQEDSYAHLDDVFPILRPLSDITEEEEVYDEEHHPNDDIYSGGKWVSFNHQGTRTLWLLKQGFDLFGLIDAGLAIDKTTLKK